MSALPGVLLPGSWRIFSGDPCPGHEDLSVFRFQQAVDQSEDGTLSAAGSSNDRDEFAPVHMKIQVVDDRFFFLRKLKDHILKVQHL